MTTMVRDRVSPTTAALQRRMQLALGALRGVTLAWSAVVCAIDASSGVLDRPAVAATVLVVLAVWSAVWTVAVGRRDRWVSGVAGILVDLALAGVAAVTDHAVYGGEHPQSFASAWPVVAVVATGIAAGPTAGLAGGTFVGLANIVGRATVGGGMDGEWLASIGTLVLLAASGWVGGWVAERLRTTAQAAADAQARAEVARTLHDGVLQTLAVVQRRSDDQDLVALAREQDAELRAFLRGDGTAAAGQAGRRSGGEDLAARLREALAGVERRQRISAQLVVVDVGSARGPAATALVGATSEAVVNAAKHAGVDQVWVSVDRRLPSGTMVVVHDEGTGFDPATVPAGDGLTDSVRARLATVDGGVDIRSAPGRGTDVTLWVP
jgi:signal transduction histidine kinase